jgi:hypothetical protein
VELDEKVDEQIMNKLFEKSQKQLVSEDNLIKEDNGN